MISHFARTNGRVPSNSASKPALDMENRYRSDKSIVQETVDDLDCNCRHPFYPAPNCTLCYYIPAYMELTYRRLELFDKKTATAKCIDELGGEIPHSKSKA